MANYTTQLRTICESITGLTEGAGNDNTDSVIASARPLIFSFNYPVVTETPKEELETKIIRHYYMREIGCETYGQWKFFLENKMNEIMPYYNELYKSVALEFNPFEDVNYSKQHYGHEDGSSNSTNEYYNKNVRTNNTSDKTEYHSKDILDRDDVHWEYYSDTPQGSVSRIGIDGNNYLTNATKNTADDKDTTEHNGYDELKKTGTVTDDGNDYRTINTGYGTNDNYTDTITGKMSAESYSSRLLEYRKTILNIDMMVIDELADLFMNIY